VENVDHRRWKRFVHDLKAWLKLVVLEEAARTGKHLICEKWQSVCLLCSMWWIPEHAQENGTKIDVQLIAGHCWNIFEDHIVIRCGHVHRIADSHFDYIYAAGDERKVQCWGYIAWELVTQ
jgi:hypothetical protein